MAYYQDKNSNLAYEENEENTYSNLAHLFACFRFRTVPSSCKSTMQLLPGIKFQGTQSIEKLKVLHVDIFNSDSLDRLSTL